MYTYEQRKAAVDAYYQYGERITYTCKKLGYYTIKRIAMPIC